MSTKKPSLGRGLTALMGSIEAAKPAAVAPAPELLTAAFDEQPVEEPMEEEVAT